MDRVFLNDFRVSGKHGVGDEERRNEQEFILDIVAECDTRKAAASDDINDAVNYSEFRKIAREVVEQNSFFLIERLAETIAQRILEDKKVAAVTVTVKKPTIYPDAMPGVTIHRTRL